MTARDLTTLSNSDAPSAFYLAANLDDANDLTNGVCRSIIVAVGGAIKLNRPDSVTVTITVPAGVLPLYAQRIWSTGTTATGITVLY